MLICSDVKQMGVLGGVKGFLVLFVAKESVLLGMLSFISYLWAKIKEFTQLAVNCFEFSRKNFSVSL